MQFVCGVFTCQSNEKVDFSLTYQVCVGDFDDIKMLFMANNKMIQWKWTEKNDGDDRTMMDIRCRRASIVLP